MHFPSLVKTFNVPGGYVARLSQTDDRIDFAVLTFSSPVRSWYQNSMISKVFIPIYGSHNAYLIISNLLLHLLIAGYTEYKIRKTKIKKLGRNKKE